MNRIRVPAGEITARQLKAICYAANNFAKGIVHITTRQDVQIHYVKLEDTIKVIEYLKDYGLSPRGGGGNTVRNVTSCFFSGVCSKEVFNTQEYAVSLTEYLLRQDTSFNLPRKLKISFSSCSKDCAGCLVNDIGFLAQEKNGKKGFKVFVGGGMGSEPELGKLFEEFVSTEDLGYCVLGIKNVFYKNGDRRNKHHNRLRFLINDLGFENFRKLYLEELKYLKDNEYISLRSIEEKEDHSFVREGRIPDEADAGFKEFIKYNIYPQKQDGLVGVELRIPRGDIGADNLESIASLEDEFENIEFRTSQSQNIFICNVKKTDTYRLFLKIKGILNSEFLYPSTVLDVVSCKGALTCNLGLCNSPGLTEEVEKVIKGIKNSIKDSLFRGLNIKINGCPNSCGQHPIGLISFYGAVRRVADRPVPFYKLLLGGQKAAEQTQLAKDTGILIPARNVPLFLKDFLEKIDSRIGNENILEYINTKAAVLAQEVAKKYSYVPDYAENKGFYIDWGKSEEFSLDGLGPGECGAGILNMIEADLADAKVRLESARGNNYSISDLKQALFFSARALLIVKGSDPKTPEAAFNDFIDKFIKQGFTNQKFSDLLEVHHSLREGLTLSELKEKFLYVNEFLTNVLELYKNMDSAFNLPKYTQVSDSQPEKEKKADGLIDLKGVKCPMNYVQAKLYLENVEVGQIIEICLDEGEPIQNVPASLKNDGQEILEIKKADGYYKVRVKKLVDG